MRRKPMLPLRFLTGLTQKALPDKAVKTRIRKLIADKEKTQKALPDKAVKTAMIGRLAS